MAATAFKIGQRVTVLGKNVKATIRYIGDVKFAPGKMIGIELDDPEVFFERVVC